VLKRPGWPEGRLVTLAHTSRVLADNPLGDPCDRTLDVWLPAAYDRQSGRRFPVLFDLVGYTGSGRSHTNWSSFAENVPERLARLVATRRLSPCIVVFPDCFTALGGNQYINSSAIGRYADYLTRELVPFVDREFRTLASRDHRGCFGKSSGGYGAMVHGMLYPDVWGAAPASLRGAKAAPRACGNSPTPLRTPPHSDPFLLVRPRDSAHQPPQPIHLVCPCSTAAIPPLRICSFRNKSHEATL
jgi:hypothetical protein